MAQTTAAQATPLRDLFLEVLTTHVKNRNEHQAGFQTIINSRHSSSVSLNTERSNSVPEKKSSVTLLERSSVQGVPEAVRAKRPILRYSWLALLIVANTISLVHLYFLVITFVEEPNSVSMEYDVPDELNFPRIHVCQPETRMIDWKSAENISQEYFYALELGVGLVHESDNDKIIYEYSLNVTLINEYLAELKDDPVGAYKQFYEKYGLKSEDLFSDCIVSANRELNCSEVFEHIFTLQGMCWVSKKESLILTDDDSLANFEFNIQFSKDMLSQTASNCVVCEICTNCNGNFPFVVGFDETLDQGNYYVENLKVVAGDNVIVRLTQSSKVLMPSAKRCAENDQLVYFPEYSRTNCNWERQILNNFNCELPLVELLNPEYKSKKKCAYEQILELFNYLSCSSSNKTTQIATTENADNGNADCSAVKNISAAEFAKLPSGKRQALSVAHYLNTVPQSLSQLYISTRNMEKESNDAKCLPICDSTSYTYRSNIMNRKVYNATDANVMLQYTTREVATFTEEPRQTTAEYIAMIGGNIGMWNGMHAIALIHLVALILGVAGFHPFSDPTSTS